MNLKHSLKVLFSGIFVRIKSGPLKGKKWIITSGGNFISGDQESYKTDAFLKYFTPGSIFFDIGAHIGYYSAIGAMLNDGKGHVYSFEPRPMNAGFFRKHMKKNGFTNVTLFEAAVGEKDGFVQFDTAHGSATGRVSSDGDLKVKQVSIDRMVGDGELPSPDFIKIDVEGGEIDVLKGLTGVVAKCRPRLIIATHNPECYTFTTDFLKKNRYRFEVLNPDPVKGDTEIVALPE
ncbi:MAG TPA: FkbM family methyltransferase [Bacteroidales bacterium]|jgi:FkbM family methyltransferase|nr:FkbM family methyltransferase [Bacteroidales bacterium]